MREPAIRRSKTSASHPPYGVLGCDTVLITRICSLALVMWKSNRTRGTLATGEVSSSSV